MPHTPCLSDGSIIMSKGGLDTCYREPALRTVVPHEVLLRAIVCVG